MRLETLPEGCAQLVEAYERRLWDQSQLLEISKSLNSGLDYDSLIRSFLHVCMGHIKTMSAALFVRNHVDSRDLSLHAGYIGFDPDPKRTYEIPEGHPVLRTFGRHFRPLTLEELTDHVPADEIVAMLASLQPVILAPLRTKQTLNGILVLSDRLGFGPLSDTELEFLETSTGLAGMAVNNAFLYEVSTTDMMTSLKLRHYFLQRLQEEKDVADKRGHRFSVVMLDIDHFKSVNDTFGHIAGDELIRAVAGTLLATKRESDVAARYGGEEFIVLLPRTTCAQAFQLAERIRARIGDLVISSDGREITATVSVGVGEYRPEEPIRKLISRTDEALYRAKTHGRNRSELAPGNRLEGIGGCEDKKDEGQRIS